MKIRYYLFLTLTFFSFFCFGQSKGNGANYTFNTKCMGTELDGSITLEVWGKGRHYFDALEQAKKNAVRDIIFRGIQDGNCQISAIVLLPKAKSTQIVLKETEHNRVLIADDDEWCCWLYRWIGSIVY